MAIVNICVFVAFAMFIAAATCSAVSAAAVPSTPNLRVWRRASNTARIAGESSTCCRISSRPLASASPCCAKMECKAARVGTRADSKRRAADSNGVLPLAAVRVPAMAAARSAVNVAMASPICSWSLRAASLPVSAAEVRNFAVLSCTSLDNADEDPLLIACTTDMSNNAPTTTTAAASMVCAVRRDVLTKMRKYETVACQFLTFSCLLRHAAFQNADSGSYASLASPNTNSNGFVSSSIFFLSLSDLPFSFEPVSDASAAPVGGARVFAYKMPRHSPIKLRRVRAMWKSAKKHTINHQIDTVLRHVHNVNGSGNKSPPEVYRSTGISIAKTAHWM
mmetsp:Transcript_116999/g.338197  ORF Transcript_116999/g.338197 Transcript_116999/m.338197 type:complete len:336 (-) Transcript_116999:1720-2727(-)